MKFSGKMKLSDAPSKAEAEEFASFEGDAAVANARKSLLEPLGLADDDKLSDNLKALGQRASDGKVYRDDLLEQIKSLNISIHGNDEKGIATAERQKKVYGSQELVDIKAEVERLKAQRDATVPGGALSNTDTTQEQVPVKVPTAHYG